jgi:hypothetical protein
MADEDIFNGRYRAAAAKKSQLNRICIGNYFRKKELQVSVLFNGGYDEYNFRGEASQ